ncbi:MAG: hypothetical protein KatS3mg002_1198 [Candidatus Woesearchaeota archaeon]|nr:MAG: hypothetical protein KatS3mg002_1198 [Candidatus Woesearchaeota archaeon]
MFNWKIEIMELIGPENKDIIESSIKAYGSDAEHNYFYFSAQESKDSKPVFAFFGENKGLLLVDFLNGNWKLLASPLADESEHPQMILEFLENVKPKSLLVETTMELRKRLLKLLKNTNIKIGNIRDRYIKPIIYLDDWDPELKGSDLSNIRKAKNRLYRRHTIELVNPKDANIAEMKQLVLDWKKNRTAGDRAYYHDYINYFAQGFPDAVASLILKIDGKICGIASGWMIPNSEKVYFAINLHNYSLPDMGDFLTVLFLNELKAKGFKYLDFGSSDEKLLQYKKKFRPREFIETACYYISVK